ncbi:MAG: type IV toxin-antitoxin system AbiEi family antitoxin [Gammaproteobacteria bacterium]|jgi:predicted transcriptional regulator of viral defense system
MKSQDIIKKLPAYVDCLQSRAEYTFSEADALQALRCSVIAFRHAAQRLVSKKRIARIRSCYYVIVPMEYSSIGVPTPHWYLDSLMRHYFKLPYYVGLLTAAALQGAAHQQPQVFQVITTKQLRPIHLPRTQIRFYVKRNIDEQFVEKRNTPAGYMSISKPELTALDLVQYAESSGHLNNVATVLAELAEALNVEQLVLAAQKFPCVVTQRLGYLLEKFTNLDIEKLHQWFIAQSIRTTVLMPGKKYRGSKQNKRWKIWVNEKVEADL